MGRFDTLCRIRKLVDTQESVNRYQTTNLRIHVGTRILDTIVCLLFLCNLISTNLKKYDTVGHHLSDTQLSDSMDYPTVLGLSEL